MAKLISVPEMPGNIGDIMVFMAVHPHVEAVDRDDPEHGAHLCVSHGRRRLGRPARYYVSVEDGGSYTHIGPQGEVQIETRSRAFGFSAWTLAEAIEKAEKRLAKR